jgi:hypothetical protein
VRIQQVSTRSRRSFLITDCRAAGDFFSGAGKTDRLIISLESRLSVCKLLERRAIDLIDAALSVLSSERRVEHHQHDAQRINIISARDLILL